MRSGAFFIFIFILLSSLFICKAATLTSLFLVPSRLLGFSAVVEKAHGPFWRAAGRIMGKLGIRKGTWESEKSKRPSHDPSRCECRSARVQTARIAYPLPLPSLYQEQPKFFELMLHKHVALLREKQRTQQTNFSFKQSRLTKGLRV